ncbi:MAG: hypothetical protein HDKAJFGB_01426 [Anaerolineae bacterium]|nr:hypothetical protein [Anaerolineae bacterium]
MQKWEYKTHSQTYKKDITGRHYDWRLEIDLRILGREGWELVSVYETRNPNSANYSGVTTEIF